MKKPLSSQHGFALVIALSIMAFALLLILSITTLVRVESQSASIGLQHLRARLNAQLGAMIALGDLQRYTGPDQRVTARADILQAPRVVGQSGQSRWTGVWSSKQNTADPLDSNDGLDSRTPRWLVSGNEISGLNLDPSVDFEDESAVESVNLATVGKSVIDKSTVNQDDTVKVPKVEILGDNNLADGHYAYWVSDEGVKARLNMADPFLNSSLYNSNNSSSDEAYYRTAMAQVADPTAVSNFDGVQLLKATSSRWKDGTLDPEKISSLKNIPMFLENDLGSTNLEGVNREFFHDFTVHSTGVLANTKDGGLKRDLSTALLNLPSDMKGPIFEPFGLTPSTGDPGGPKWEQLADYYQLSRDTMNSNTLQLRVPTTEQVGIAPVVTRWNLPFYGFADYNGYGDEWTTGGYNYSIGLFPLITLWNPYSKDLELPEIGIEFMFPGTIDIWSVRLADANTDYPRELVATINVGQWQAGSTFRHVIKFRIKPITIPAGEAFNFTPPHNSIFDRPASQEGRNNILVQGGWSGGNMNGFFTEPVAGTGTGEFLYNAFATNIAGDRATWQHASKRLVPVLSRGQANSGGNLWRPVLNLYDLSTNDTFDINGSNRFKSLTFWGLSGEIGDYSNDNFAHNPRVVRLNRIDNLSAQLLDSPRFSNFLEPVGSSDGASFSDPGTNSATFLPDMDHWSMVGRTFGISAALKFSDMPFDSTREIPIHLFRNFNPTAPVVQRPINAQTDYWGSIATMYTRGPSTVFGGDNSINYMPGTEYPTAPVGLDYGTTLTSGSDKAVLYDISMPISIGHLMHANLFNFYGTSDTLEISNGLSKHNYKFHSNVNQALYSIPSHAIGNSYPDIHIPLNSSKLNPSSNSYTTNGGASISWGHYDYSFELNSSLWDGYFFSGIDPLASTSFPLPNARLKDVAVDETFSLINEQQVAGRLMLEGAFNVNSTSISAWESILGAMREIDNIGGGSASSAELLHNFSRFKESIEDSTSAVPDLSGDADAIAAGFRSLSDGQIASLASEIVSEIRLRTSTKDAAGHSFPFTSVSNFINRSLDVTTREFALSGVLQAAIDKSGINGLASKSTGMWEKGNVDYYPLYGEGDLTAEARPRTDGMPGALTQADLLNKIGHLLQARSDTFVIRSSGDTVSGFSADTNQPSAQAYYEIVVQRMPEYIDPSQLAYNRASSDINLQFGRKYRIVSQGWVSGDNI